MKNLALVLVLLVSGLVFSQSKDTIIPIAYMEHQHYFLVNHGVEDYLSVDDRFILGSGELSTKVDDETLKLLNKHQKSFVKSDFSGLKNVPDTLSVISVDEYRKLLGNLNISEVLDITLSSYVNGQYKIKKSIIGFHRLYRAQYGTPIIDILEMATFDTKRNKCTIKTVIVFQDTEGDFDEVTYFNAGYDGFDGFHYLK